MVDIIYSMSPIYAKRNDTVCHVWQTWKTLLCWTYGKYWLIIACHTYSNDCLLFILKLLFESNTGTYMLKLYIYTCIMCSNIINTCAQKTLFSFAQKHFHHLANIEINNQQLFCKQWRVFNPFMNINLGCHLYRFPPILTLQLPCERHVDSHGQVRISLHMVNNLRKYLCAAPKSHILLLFGDTILVKFYITNQSPYNP